jgi:hypothetical protein
LDISPTLTTIRTTPSATQDILKTIDIANNGAGDAVVSAYLIPSGGSADADTCLLPAITIPVNTVLQWSGMQVLDAGATIKATADIAGVTFTASGGNVT